MKAPPRALAAGAATTARPTPARPSSTSTRRRASGDAHPRGQPFTREGRARSLPLLRRDQLSGNQTQSCGSCHRQSLAFTDGRAVSTGSTGDHTAARRSPALASVSLVNVGYAVTLMWPTPRCAQLERQALVPDVRRAPGWNSASGMEARDARAAAGRLPLPGDVPRGVSRAGRPVTLDNVTKAIATFERAILRGLALRLFARYQRGDHTALSASAKRG